MANQNSRELAYRQLNGMSKTGCLESLCWHIDRYDIIKTRTD